MIFNNDFPALKSCTYFNTAYVGLMSQSLYDFRTDFEQNYLLNGDQYIIEAYEQLDITHATIAQFVGSKKEQTYFVSNFSVGVRYVLDTLKKGSNILCIKDDYHSLIDATVERDFNLFYLTMEERLEDKIDHALAQNKFDVFVISIVQYTNGLKIDFDFLDNLRNQYPKLLIIGDATQFIGTDHFDFSTSPFDAVVCSGYKWLLAGFGNGFVTLSDRFFELTDTKEETFYQKVFSGHFNILGAASLVFAINYLTAHDFGQLVKKNKILSNKLRKELLNLGWIPKFHQRTSQSSILSIASEEKVLKSLEAFNVRAAYRGKYLRFSIHFYNTKKEIDQLINIIKELYHI